MKTFNRRLRIILPMLLLSMTMGFGITSCAPGYYTYTPAYGYHKPPPPPPPGHKKHKKHKKPKPPKPPKHHHHNDHGRR